MSAFFGFRLPYVPDFLSDHTLLQEEPHLRLAEHCKRWTRLLGGLWRPGGVAYALVYWWVPQSAATGGGDSAQLQLASGTTNTFLVGRVDIEDETTSIPKDVERALVGLGLSPLPMNPDEVNKLLTLSERYKFEVRQREFRTGVDAATVEQRYGKKLAPEEMATLKSGVYGILPWWGPGGSFTVAFDVLAAQSSSVKVFAILEPCDASSHLPATTWFEGWARRLEKWADDSGSPSESVGVTEGVSESKSDGTSEQKVLKSETFSNGTSWQTGEGSSASKGESLNASHSEGESETFQKGTSSSRTVTTGLGSYSSKDPQARWMARDATAFLRRLMNPYLSTTIVASEDRAAAHQVAQSLSSAISEELPFEPPTAEDHPRASGVECVELETHQGLAATLLLGALKFTEKGLNTPTLALAHEPAVLRYLMDARGAASMFRFPVNIRGGIAGIPVRQQPPTFDPGARAYVTPPDALQLGTFHSGGLVTIPLADLSRHALISGFTGSGKTNTVLFILNKLWRWKGSRPPEIAAGVVEEVADLEGIPFLVLENAKTDYRGLLGIKSYRAKRKLRVFTLGDDGCSAFRLNPFQLLSGIRVESHIGRLLDCFLAALPPLPFIPSILADAFEKAYAQRGWRLNHSPTPNEWRQFPTISEVYDSISEIVVARRYSDEAESNIRASLETRIKPLLMGSLGKMFDVQASIPPQQLFNESVIIELEELRLEDKALVMMFLLVFMREYRSTTPPSQRPVEHVTVIEEAHQVFAAGMGAGGGEGASETRAKAVEAFSNMLAEIRAYGEGIIIVDQSPEKLAADALRNTNLHIAHQLRDARDREAIAKVASMDDDQRDYLARMRHPYAAVYFGGLEKASFMRVPLFVNAPTLGEEANNEWCGYRPVSREEVRQHMADLIQAEPAEDLYSECWVGKCQPECLVYRRVFAVHASDMDLNVVVGECIRDLGRKVNSPTVVSQIARYCLDVARRAGDENTIEAATCCFRQFWAMHRRDLLRVELMASVREAMLKMSEVGE